MTRYIRVNHKSGAFIDGIWYPSADDAKNIQDAIVPMELSPNAPVPIWGTETDQFGNELGGEQPTEQPIDKLNDALANKIAAGAGEAPAATKTPAVEDKSKDAVQRKQVILDTLELLDHKDDSHWTAEGLPNMNVVCETAGIQVTRAELTETAPDFKRIK